MNNTCISLSLSRPTPFLLLLLFLLLLHNSLQLPALPPTPPPPHSTLPNPSLPTPSASLSSTPTAASPVVSGASTGSGQYFVHLRLGSPQQPLLLVADTGSDLVCLRCSASKSCSRRLPGSAFLACHSSTFSSFRVLPPPLPKVRWFMLATLVVTKNRLGHSPVDVKAGLSSPDKTPVSKLKENMKQFQVFFAYFEGIMLIEMSKECY
ncbi:hypothetical protein ACLB2K_044071 [Fragaria x ananassa]